MRAARLHEYTEDVPSALNIEEVDAPQITQSDDVLVEVKGTGWCQTDHKVIKGMLSEAGGELPMILGHEPAGTVKEVGDQVSSVSNGDTVIVLGAVTCGLCRACRDGRDFHCEKLDMPGITSDGGFAEYLVVPERSVLQTDLDPVQAAPYSDAGVTSYRAAKKASQELVPGDYAAIIGIGGLGHLGLQSLKALSPAKIIAVDVRQEALELAEELGAAATVNPTQEDAQSVIDDITNGRGVTQAIDYVGQNQTFDLGIHSLEMNGDHHVVGYGGHIEDLPLGQLTANESGILGNLVGTFNELREVVTLAEDGRVELHVSEYTIDEINEVAAMMQNGEIEGRAVITP